MRITTNMSMRNYQTGLGKTLANQDIARTRVMTKRNFNKISEDPSGALKAFRLRRDFAKTDDYLETLKSAQSELASVESSEKQIKSILDQAVTLVTEAVGGIMSPEDRKIIATEIRGLQESMLLSANAKFGNKFLFGGASTSEAPFALDANGKLSYRGVEVSNTGEMDKLAKEKLYVDLGFGLEVDDNRNVVDSTAYNTAIIGIGLLGYGDVPGTAGTPGNPSGISKNAIVLLGQIAETLEKPDLKPGEMAPFQEQLTKATDKALNTLTMLGTNDKFLQDTESRLEDNMANLNEAIVKVEDVSMAGAITEYMWAQYAYNAALKVGNSLLSTSFIDFMR